MTQGVDTFKMVPLAPPAGCPLSNDPLFKVSEGRPLRSNRTRDGEGVKKWKGFSDDTFLSLRSDKSLASGKKYLTKYLICNNIIQYEESGSKESKFTEEDPGLF